MRRQKTCLSLITWINLLGIVCGGLTGCRAEEALIPQPSPAEDFFVRYRSDLPAYEHTGATLFTFDDRTLVLSDRPENTAERMVADHYSWEIAFEFEKMQEQAGVESLRLSAENEAENAQKGLYFTKLTIHALDTLTQEDFVPGGAYFAEEAWAERFQVDLEEKAEACSLAEYTVVYADLTWKWSQTALELGPQIGDGRCERLFFLGRPEGSEEWKLYGLYWGELTLNRVPEPKNDPLAERLAETAMEDYQWIGDPDLTVLLFQTVKGRSVLLVEVQGGPHVGGMDNLVLGVWDPEQQEFTGQTHVLRGDSADYTAWPTQGGSWDILWTNCAVNFGEETCQGLGYFRFDGEELRMIEDLPPYARDSGALPDDPRSADLLRTDTFWSDYKARPIQNGFQLYMRNPDYYAVFPPDVEEQWAYVGFVPFDDREYDMHLAPETDG